MLEQELGDAFVDGGDVPSDDVEVEYAEDDEGLWDDLPETEIEIGGDDDDAIFDDFDDVELYEGLPAEEDIAVDVEAEDDEDVVIEAGPDVEGEEFEVGEDFLDEEAGWSREQWSECARRMVQDAKDHDDGRRAARLLAEAGRISEVRLDDGREAGRLYRSAHEIDSKCLTAVQGLRRLQLAEGETDAARALVQDELGLARDSLIRRRLECLDLEIRGFRQGEMKEAAQGLSRSAGAGDGDTYGRLVALASALESGSPGDGFRAALELADQAQDKLFVSSLRSAAGLLAELAGDGDAASTAYRGALEARSSDEMAMNATWRLSVMDRAWAEAEQASRIQGLDTSSSLGLGHGFLRAAQQIIALSRVEDAREVLALLPRGMCEQWLRVLSCLGDRTALSGALDELESMLPDGRLRGVLMWERAAGLGSEEAVEVLRGVLEQAPELDEALLELVRRLASREELERSSVLHALVDEALERPGSAWLVLETVLSLLECGRSDEAVKIADRLFRKGASEGILLGVLLKLLSTGQGAHASELMEAHAGRVSDLDLRQALELARLVLLEFETGDAEGAAEKLSGMEIVGPMRNHVLREVALQGGRVDRAMIDAGLGGDDGAAAVPPVLAMLRQGGLEDADDRIAVLRRVIELDPSHLVAFTALRRELLEAGLVEEYGRELDAWVQAAGSNVAGRIQGERIALLSLGAGSSLSEQDLRSRLEASGADTFLPLFISGLAGFPTLAAESAERIASGLDGGEADRWWCEAARRWAALDFQKTLSALSHVSHGAWSPTADALLEACSWISGRWDEVAGRLIGAMKELPDGEVSEPVLSRMVYVDGVLKGETSMALAEAEPLLELPRGGNLFCLRTLYTELLSQGRVDEAARPLASMAVHLAGSDESSAFAWLATRRWRGDVPSLVERADALVRDVLEARAQDLPLLLVADAQARRRGDRDLLVSVMSEMAGAMEGDREQGAIMWVLAMLFADRDPERALSLAREAQEKLGTNPLAALLVEQMATEREDWATAAAFARQAASLTRQLAFGVEDFLRAGEIYRDKLKEGGWAVQCFEQAVSLDPSDPRGFETLRDHFSSLGEWDRVATLIEERILAMEEPEVRYELLRELAHVYEQAGRQEEAIAALRRVLAEQPEDPACLDSLSNLCVRAGLWDEAVSTLQERAMLPMTPEQGVEVFRKLGGLYVDQMPNDQRAIVCFEKVLQAGETDLDVVRQLAALYEKTGAWEKGLKMAEHLYNNAEDDDEKARWLVAAGRLWQKGGGDLRRAEQTFEMARKLVPGSPDPIVSLVGLYKEQGDERALSFHLERSLGDLQVFAKTDPGNLTLYHTVLRIALETGVARDIRIAGTLLGALFDLHVDEQVALEKAGGRLAYAPGPWLMEPALDDLLAPRSFTPSFRILVARLRDVLLKSVGYEPKQYGISRATRLSKLHPADNGLVEEEARNLGVKPLQVHLTDIIPNCLTVLPDSPPLLVVGEPLYTSLTESQKRFAFAWGTKLSAAGLVPFVSMTEANLPALWVALIQQFEPSYFVSGVSADSAAALSASLRKNFPRKAREELLGAALECSGDQLIEVQNLHGDMAAYADCAALLSCGDIPDALQFVWQVSSGEEPFASDFAAQAALRESSELVRLVEFVVSGRFARCLPGEE